jgi:hypothetical protein
MLLVCRCLLSIIMLVEEEEEIMKIILVNSLVLGNSHRDTIVAGNFGLGGQETARIPGARESERLFLVGWEVNTQFGQLGRIIKNQEGIIQLSFRLR